MRKVTVLHILMFDDQPIAAAERMERLSEQMAAYTPNQQALMYVVSVPVLD